MIIIRTQSDVDTFMKKYPQTVIDECMRLAKIFDDFYNCDDVDGGFIAVIENETDLQFIKVYHVDYTDLPYELADEIPNSDFVSVLFLVGTEYGINLIVPKNLLPANIKISQET